MRPFGLSNVDKQLRIANDNGELYPMYYRNLIKYYKNATNKSLEVSVEE
jgi:hypothetical protein